ncbi:MAG: hypothetical protein QNJ37_01775 [Crocosphaera sp.]|nr:hypothetical protein [Crocosphaera sp.]
MTEREFQTIIDKFDSLDKSYQILSEKLELYKKVSDDQINAIRFEIKAYQDANKQQLNVSLGVLVTAAVAILVSVILSMTN